MNEKIKGEKTDRTYEELIAALKEYDREYDFEKINKAYEFARKAHDGQKRKSGAPYITHPLTVAFILAKLGMDTDSICAALLHDVVEDTPVSLEEVKKCFGNDVATLTDGVTKLGKIPFSSREEQQAENIRKMLIAMADDIRVIIIKLADRLHNMRTMKFMPEQKRRDKALETMEVYAPIAHRLGIRTIKDEMENLSLKYLDPVGYSEIENALEMKSSDREKFVSVIKEQIKNKISHIIPDVYIDGRVKSINGIYRKIFLQGKSIEQIYDIYAVRVIVDTVNDCYNVLGIIHDMYTPLPNRFKDYISTPKPNLYQSLHTTVLGKESIPFEVQIRTWDMHYTAEYGIAAHWKYKTGVTKDDSLDKKLVWIRQMLENQQDSEDSTDLIRTIKTDLSSEEVFVFTPKGDVITLPVGSTAIDFAYAIHSEIGNRMVGAKADGRIVPIDYKLKTGEIMEVLTTKEQGHGPSRDWLKIVKSSEARSKIRQWFKKEKREENIIEGRNEVEREFRRNAIILEREEMEKFLEKIASRQHCKSVDDLYAAIAYGGIQLWRIMPRIKEEYNKIVKPKEDISQIKAQKPIPNKASNGVVVEGLDNCLVKFSKCCNPLPGDDIIGFITRGYGVSIHKKDCYNVPSDIESSDQPERWIKVHWDVDVKEHFESTLEILATDRSGLLADLVMQLTNMHLFIHSLNSREVKDNKAKIYATITVNDLDHLKSVISRLLNIKGIISIGRS